MSFAAAEAGEERPFPGDRIQSWPLAILGTSVVQLGVFLLCLQDAPTPSELRRVLLESPLVFRPDQRAQVWRFVLYAFLHAGPWHLALNLLVQLLLGMPLEMVHGSLRCAGLYVGGVLAGSLASSMLDAHVYLVGASGGVYALLAAHLANVLLNYGHMRLPALRLVGVAFIASVDVSLAILDHYYGGHGGRLPVSYLAHLAGAMAGLALGLLLLRSFGCQRGWRWCGAVLSGVFFGGGSTWVTTA